VISLPWYYTIEEKKKKKNKEVRKEDETNTHHKITTSALQACNSFAVVAFSACLILGLR
jgi:hypothetical protein